MFVIESVLIEDLWPCTMESRDLGHCKTSDKYSIKASLAALSHGGALMRTRR
jgi:hypothetical protein